MCGIYGIVSKTLSREEITFRLLDMGRLQRHRGPDDQREMVFSTKNCLLGFGFVRLSILDLETGMQPIKCAKDNTAIICNGQIYNYIELRSEVSSEPFVTRGDIEVALHLYRTKGLDFLQYLNGMYAGAIFDPIHKRLLIFRDRFGIKPLYYSIWDNNFIFSSEIKPLLFGCGLQKRLNYSRLATLFTYRYLPGEETMFHGLRRLPPGSYLEYELESGQYYVKRYWNYYLDRENPKLSLDEADEQFNALLSDAIRIRLRSDVEVGSLLSSGIDSSAVTSKVAQIKPDVKLFTISFDEEIYNELPQVEHFLASNPARFKSINHYTRLCGREMLSQLPDVVYSLEEPISLGAVLPTDQICQLASEHIKVVLTGEGADEIFAGYRKFFIEMLAHQYDRLPVRRQIEMRKLYPELNYYMGIRDINPVRRYIQSELLFTRNELCRLLGQEPPIDLFPADALPVLSGNEHPLNAAQAMESRSRLPDYVILRLDKLSMRHSLETRTPFLDYRLAEFAATIPVEFKINLDTGQEKFICRYAYAKHSILDEDTAYRKKLPFTIPLANWLADPSALPECLQDIFLGDAVKKQGILDGDIVKELVSKVSADGIGPQTLVSDADRLLAIAVFTMWYNEFFN